MEDDLLLSEGRRTWAIGLGNELVRARENLQKRLETVIYTTTEYENGVGTNETFILYWFAS